MASGLALALAPGVSHAGEAAQDTPFCTVPASNPVGSLRADPSAGSVSIPEIEPNDTTGTAMFAAVNHFVPNINVLGTLNGNEKDFVQVELAKGDVLGIALLSGDFDSRVMILDPNNNIMVFNDTGFTFYPEVSQLPIMAWPTDAGGAIVAHSAGLYTIRIDTAVNNINPNAAYNMQLRLRRNALETAAPGTKQILYVDFDGAILNPNVIFGLGFPINVTLSPLDAFLPDWGLALSDRDLLIDTVLATIEQNMSFTSSQNSLVGFEIRNSRDHPDPFGIEPHVTRCVVGGTIGQLTISTIGIAQSIDPGNADTNETAVVLLDVLSDTNPLNSTSLNNFQIAPGFHKAQAVGRALGNLVSHEFGHTFGCYHTNNSNPNTCLMDSGGGLFYLTFYQSGPDFILGSADDNETNFTVDLYANEGIGINPVSREYAIVRVGYALTTPLQSCLSDVNKDTLVDAQDLGGLLGAWLKPVFLPEDINANGIVDSGDLGLLLGNWGLPGITDFDNNGSTGGNDLGALIAAWGQSGAAPFDLNNDLSVDSADLGLLLGQWGACP
jgi:hypothetical protein